jgi:transcriptional regulator with XRE-family HTH domain
MNINNLTAAKIKEIRTQKGLSSETVATQLGKDKSNYSKLENGRVEITISTIDSLSKIFNVPLIDLLPVTKGNTININHGTHSFNGTQINNQIDPDVLAMLHSTIQMWQDKMSK